MREDEFFDSMLEEYRQDFLRGDYKGAVQAVLLCAWNERALPEWAANEAAEAIKFYYRNAGADTGGRGGGFAVQSELAGIHLTRSSAFELALRDGERGAAKRASDMLLNTKAWGSPRQVKRSHE